jgi:hypothetical protein
MFAFAAGVLIALAEALLHPTIVLVFFVSELTGSLQTIGLVVTVGMLGWYIPQVLMPWVAGPSSRQMPWALGASLVRAAAVIFLAYTGYRNDASDAERLRSFFVCYVAFCVASGFTQTPINELIARGLPGRRLDSMIRNRNLAAGLLAVIAALVARESLGPNGPAFPRNITLLFIAAATAISAATFFIARIREPDVLPRGGTAGAAPRLAALWRTLLDGAFRRYLLFGVLLAVSTLADTYYVVYARREYDLPPRMIGTFLAIFAAAVLIASPLWSGIARSGGARAALQAASTLRVIAPLSMLFLPYAIESKFYQDRVGNEQVLFYLLAIPFALQGIALRGLAFGNFAYVAAITLPERRAAYHILALSPMLVAAFAPIAGARLIGRWGFERLFLVALLTGFVAILASGLLAQTSSRIRSPVGAWRLRDLRAY